MLSGPVVGRLLQTLVHVVRPKLVVEVGTYSGYSALSMAAALPSDGRIITCEFEEAHAAVAEMSGSARSQPGRLRRIPSWPLRALLLPLLLSSHAALESPMVEPDPGRSMRCFTRRRSWVRAPHCPCRIRVRRRRRAP